MAKGSVDMDTDYCLYTIGLQSKDVIACGLDAADLVITLGYDMVEYHPYLYLWNPYDDKRSNRSTPPRDQGSFERKSLIHRSQTACRGEGSERLLHDGIDFKKFS